MITRRYSIIRAPAPAPHLLPQVHPLKPHFSLVHISMLFCFAKSFFASCNDAILSSTIIFLLLIFALHIATELFWCGLWLGFSFCIVLWASSMVPYLPYLTYHIAYLLCAYNSLLSPRSLIVPSPIAIADRPCIVHRHSSYRPPPACTGIHQWITTPQEDV